MVACPPVGGGKGDSVNTRLRSVLAALVLTGIWATGASADDAIPEPTVPEAWRAMDVGGLLSLSGELAWKGDAAKADRALLAQYAGFRSLNDASVARSVGISSLTAFVASLGQDMSDALRAQWRTRLRAAFAFDQAAVCGLTDDDFAQLADSLRRLGDGDVPSLWASRVEGKYLTDQATIRSASPTTWQYRVRQSKDALAAAAKAEWAAKLRAAFAGSREAVVALDAEAVRDLTGALVLLGDKEPNSPKVTWSSAAETWGAADLDGICSIALTLSGAGADSAAARASLAEHVAEKYMTDPAAVATISLARWLRLVGYLARDMSEPTRRSWATGLRGAYASGPQALSAVDAEGFQVLVALLGKLRDQETPSLTMAWMGASDAWRSLNYSGLKTLAGRLGKLGRDGETARAALGEHLTNLCTQDPARARAMGCGEWSSLSREFPKDAVPAQVRQALAAAVRSVFAGNPAVLANLRAGDFQNLCAALKSLGDTQTASLAAQWMEASDAWKAGDLAWFIRALPVAGDAAVDAKRLLAQQVEAEYLAGPEAIRSVRPATWLLLCRALRDVLAPGVQAEWAGKLRTAFLDESAGELSREDRRALSEALRELGDKASAAQCAREWLAENQEDFAGQPLGDLVALVAIAAQGDRSQVVPLMEKIDALCLAQASAGQLPPGGFSTVARAWASVDDSGKARAWALRAYNVAVGSEQARADADVRTLNAVVGTMHHVGLLDRNSEEYPAFAEVAARLGREGKLADLEYSSGPYAHWGMLLQMPQSRQTLEAALVDDQGAPRLPVAKILAWAYRKADMSEAWRNKIDEKLAAATAPDTKALWMLVRAYMEKQPWLDQALATAESESCRLCVLRELVAAHTAETRHDQALSLIDSLAGQFSAQESVAVLDALRQRVEQDRTEALARRVRRNAARQRKTTQVMRQELLRRLAVAEKKGNREETARLRQLVEQHQ